MGSKYLACDLHWGQVEAQAEAEGRGHHCKADSREGGGAGGPFWLQLMPFRKGCDPEWFVGLMKGTQPQTRLRWNLLFYF